MESYSSINIPFSPISQHVFEDSRFSERSSSPTLKYVLEVQTSSRTFQEKNDNSPNTRSIRKHMMSKKLSNCKTMRMISGENLYSK